MKTKEIEKEIELKKDIDDSLLRIYNNGTSEIEGELIKFFLAGQNSKEKKDLEIIKKGFEGCDDLVDLEKELTQKIKGDEE
jgi:hypothetical protein